MARLLERLQRFHRPAAFWGEHQQVFETANRGTGPRLTQSGTALLGHDRAHGPDAARMGQGSGLYNCGRTDRRGDCTQERLRIGKSSVFERLTG